MPVGRVTLVVLLVVEQITSRAIMWHVKDKQVIRPGQHGFAKGRACFSQAAHLLYSKVAISVAEGGLWVLSAWTSGKPEMLFPTAFFWRSWLLKLACAYTLLGKKLAGWPCPESGGEWRQIQWAAGHQCCSPGLGVGTCSL